MSRALSHKGTITKLISTQDSRFLFSAGEDGNLFIYHIEEEKIPEQGGELLSASHARAMAIEQANKVYKFEDDASHNPDHMPMMDPELANIVLVKKCEMEQW